MIIEKKNKVMEKEFLKYNQSIDLRELGFDEPCLAWHVSEKFGLSYAKVANSVLLRDAVVAPLYQQAFLFLVALQDEFKVSLDDEGWFIYNLEDDVFMGDEALSELINAVKRIKNGKKI